MKTLQSNLDPTWNSEQNLTRFCWLKRQSLISDFSLSALVWRQSERVFGDNESAALSSIPSSTQWTWRNSTWGCGSTIAMATNQNTWSIQWRPVRMPELKPTPILYKNFSHVQTISFVFFVVVFLPFSAVHFGVVIGPHLLSLMYGLFCEGASWWTHLLSLPDHHHNVCVCYTCAFPEPDWACHFQAHLQRLILSVFYQWTWGLRSPPLTP